MAVDPIAKALYLAEDRSAMLIFNATVPHTNWVFSWAIRVTRSNTIFSHVETVGLAKDRRAIVVLVVALIYSFLFKDILTFIL